MIIIKNIKHRLLVVMTTTRKSVTEKKCIDSATRKFKLTVTEICVRIVHSKLSDGIFIYKVR